MTDSKLTPAYDNKIYQKYSKKTIQNKEKNKISFCQDLEMPYVKNVPLICIPYPLVEQNNLALIQEIMPGILENAVQLVVCAIGSSKYQQFFTELAERFPQKVSIAEGGEDEKRKIYAASDMMLVASASPDCLEDAKAGMNYGVVPIISGQKFVEDYNPIQERGNAFVYAQETPWSVFAGFVRACENFRFPYDWRNIQLNAME